MRREERTERTERSQEARGMMRSVKKNYVYNPTMVAVVEELTDEMLRAAVENAKVALASKNLEDFDQEAEEITVYAQRLLVEALNEKEQEIDEELYKLFAIAETIDPLYSTQEDYAKMSGQAEMVVAKVKAVIENTIEQVEDFCSRVDSIVHLAEKYCAGDDVLEEAKRDIENMLRWQFVGNIRYHLEVALNTIRETLRKGYVDQWKRGQGA